MILLMFWGETPPAIHKGACFFASKTSSTGIESPVPPNAFSLLEPRVLIDAKSEKALGGTGDSIPVELVLEAKKHAPLWIAGGVSPQNIRSEERRVGKG